MAKNKNNDFGQQLEQTYYKMSKAKGYTLIDHAFKQAYNGKDVVLVALLKKFLADKKEPIAVIDNSVNNQYVQIFRPEAYNAEDVEATHHETDRNL